MEGGEISMVERSNSKQHTHMKIIKFILIGFSVFTLLTSFIYCIFAFFWITFDPHKWDASSRALMGIAAFVCLLVGAMTTGVLISNAEDELKLKLQQNETNN